MIFSCFGIVIAVCKMQRIGIRKLFLGHFVTKTLKVVTY